MNRSLNLTAFFDQVTLSDEERKQPALLRKPILVTAAKQALGRLDNDKVGICPHCSGKMVRSKINVARIGALPVYVCPSDRYVAPLPNGPDMTFDS